MTTSHGLGDTFGYQSFDHFLVEKWDPASSIDQDEQERNLVKAWIGMGKNGRCHYHERAETLDIPFPDHIPPTLSAFERRRIVGEDEWSTKRAIWIRTWYGNEDGSGKEETVTRASADKAYLRLWRKALFPEQMHCEFDEDMFGPFVFDDNDAYKVLARDADDEVELMDEIPSFILSALVRCPDVMDASSWGKGLDEDDVLASRQDLLVVIADGEACEEGWVLEVALNHKGQALHRRVRSKAWLMSERMWFWRDKGVPLDESESRDNLMDYLDANQSGNGWDSDEPLKLV